jgi:hypothetical protein
MSDFCIYPHSGIPQGLKGLILVKNPWFKIVLLGGTLLPPSLGHVTSTASTFQKLDVLINVFVCALSSETTLWRVECCMLL